MSRRRAVPSRLAPPRGAGAEGALGAKSSAVASPCINVCRMDAATGWCEGCQRTLDEIAAWASLGDDAKRAVWQQLPARREAYSRLHLELTAKTGTNLAERRP